MNLIQMPQDEGEHFNSLLGLKFDAFQITDTGNLVYLLLSVLSLGIIPIICSKYPKYGVALRFRKSSFSKATHIVISGARESGTEAKVYQLDGVRYFEYKKQRFVYQELHWTFVLQKAILTQTAAQIHDMKKGKSSHDAWIQTKQTGTNEILIDDIPVLSMLMSKCTEMFYLFQMASVSIWIYIGYTTYAILIFTMSVISIIWEIYSAKSNEKQLRSLTKQETDFFVLRDGVPHKLASQDLVIGDAVLLDYNTLSLSTKVPCDLVLIQGECVMDESSLTGETIPVVKVPLSRRLDVSDGRVDPERNKNNILFGGSVIKQLKPKNDRFRIPTMEDTSGILKSVKSVDSFKNEEEVEVEMDQLPTKKQSVIAIVYATGFSTAKGQLFQSILFPTEIEFQYTKDSLKFLMVLGIIALIAAINRIADSVKSGQTIINAILSSLDLVTIAVPPALPLILTVGIGFSLQRLKQVMIYCMNPERLNYAGRMDVMCWDKTGTITTAKLHFETVYKVNSSDSSLDFSPQYLLDNPFSLERIMVTCHGVTKDLENHLCGHSLDKETFAATGWDISSNFIENIKYQGISLNVNAVIHPKTSFQSPIYIILRLEFDAHLQRSSVISLSSNDATPIIMTKGSPEAIKMIVDPSSIPSNFDELCNQYSIQGFYVIACAVRVCTTQDLKTLHTIKRSQIESNLKFIGFLLFRNPLKPAAKDTFQKLKQANIRSIIITGDNAWTAIHVARQLEMCQLTFLIDYRAEKLTVNQVPEEQDESTETEINSNIYIKNIFDVLDSHPGSELCITGAALRYMIVEEVAFLDRIMSSVRIFSRTKPNDKTWIIEWLIKNGSFVGMCGDGTNDCGALKAAHVGLALSSAEASIVAPFTSAQKRMEDIVEVVKEGRCALETSFIGFKFMTLYPLIQLMMSATMNHFGGALSNNQFLFDDMCIVTVLALFCLYTKPNPNLSPSRPTDNLFSAEIMATILGQLSLCVFFFLLNVGLTLAQPWFCSISKATEFLNELFEPIDPSLGEKNYPCYPINPQNDVSLSLVLKSYENTSIWTFSHFQFAIVVFSISMFSHFRKPFWSNLYFTLYWILIMSVLTFLLISLLNTSTAKLPSENEYDSFLAWLFLTQPGIPSSFRYLQLGLTFLHLLLSIGWERIVEWYRLRMLAKPSTAV